VLSNFNHITLFILVMNLITRMALLNVKICAHGYGEGLMCPYILQNASKMGKLCQL
jgi:hypothetical protein